MESFSKKLIKAMEEGLKNLKEKPESPLMLLFKEK